VTGWPGATPVITAALMVHLYPGVPVRVSLHPEEDRAVVGIGTGTLMLDLFCGRAELVALRDTLTAAVTDLNTAQHGPASAGGETAGPDEVDAPAA
jgi:hypothetical protein